MECCCFVVCFWLKAANQIAITPSSEFHDRKGYQFCDKNQLSAFLLFSAILPFTMCRYRKIVIILIISLFSIFYNVMVPAVQSAPNYPRNRMKRTSHNYPYPVVYERLMRRCPSIYPNDLYMEEFMEIFHLNHPIRKHTMSDDEMDRIIRCDFDPSLKECELLQKPEEGFIPKPPQRFPPFPPSVLKPATTTPIPTRTTTAINWPWTTERTTITPKTHTTTDINGLWSAEETTRHTPGTTTTTTTTTAKTTTSTESKWPWSAEETTTITEPITTTTDYLPLLPDIPDSNEQEAAPGEEYDDNETETTTENYVNEDNNNSNNHDDGDDDVNGGGNYDEDENEIVKEDAENYDEHGEKNYNLVFN